MSAPDQFESRSSHFPEWYALVDVHHTNSSGTERHGTRRNLARKQFDVVGPQDGIEMSRLEINGKSICLFEGYLFEADSLAADLGLNVRQASDGAIVAAGFARRGEAIFNHLTGRYLAAFWDDKEQCLIVGHDGLGRHPVYFSACSNGLIFSSNIFALAYSGMIRRAPNRVSFALRLLGQWPAAGETFFAGISRLRPGCFLRFKRSGQPEEIRYWNVYPDGDLGSLNDKDAFELFETEFIGAIDRCMHRNPQGIMFSGGIDSVSVATLASEYLRRNGLPPLTACSGRNPPGYSASWEDEAQDRTAQRLGMRLWPSHAGIWLGKKDLLTATLEEVPNFPGPTDTWWAGAYIGFYRTVSEAGLTRLLTGSGGDEWLGVHPSYAADLLRKMDLIQLARFLQAETRTGGRSLWSAVHTVLWRNGFRLFLRSFADLVAEGKVRALHRRGCRQNLPSWFCPDEQLAEQLTEALCARIVPALTEDRRLPRSFYRHFIRCLGEHPLMTYEFERQYHMSRRLGMEFLHPFHDMKLTHLCNELSPDALVQGSRYKGLLRPLMEKRLPGLGLERQRKESGGVNPENYTNRELIEHLHEHWSRVGCRKMRDLGLVDEVIADKLARHNSQLNIPSAAQLFTVLSAETWLSAHVG